MGCVVVGCFMCMGLCSLIFQLILGLYGEQMVMAFEDEFAVEIPDAEAEKIHTVEQAVNYIASHSQAK